MVPGVAEVDAAGGTVGGLSTDPGGLGNAEPGNVELGNGGSGPEVPTLAMGGSVNTGGAPGGPGPMAEGGSGSGGTSGSIGNGFSYSVNGRFLYDVRGERVVLKGVNHPTIYIDRAGAALPEIAMTGANAVRIFWFADAGISINEADGVVGEAIRNGMVPILEMHDATGPASWGNLDAILDYWTSADAVSLIAKYEQNFILNIANEAGPETGQDYPGFQSAYEDAITRIRDAGIRVPLMIDASGWGRDEESLFATGPALLAHDPLGNVVFSWHAYNPLDAAEITAVLERSVDLDLPFLVGEFANRSPTGTCGPDIDYLAIIRETDTRDIGWLAWSWGDDDPTTAWNGDCAEFDMTETFEFSSLGRWGLEVAVSDEASLQQSAVRPASLISDGE